MAEEFEITPHAYSKPVKNQNIHSLSYTNQDFWSWKGRMIELIKQEYGKDFNDFTESSLAIMLIEQMAFIADTLSFKIDQIANEVFVDTVTEQTNMLRLAKLVGFKPMPPIPARAMFVLTLNHPLTFDLPIVVPLIISYPALEGREKTMELYQTDTNNNPVFNKKIIIPAGSVSINNVIGIEGRSLTRKKEGTGMPWQVVDLELSNILMGSIRVAVDGSLWQEVESYTDSNPRREFRVEYSTDYKAHVLFGNNKAGLVPPKGSQINISFRTGGGEMGNVISGSINKQVPIITPGLSYHVSVNVSNYTPAQFGHDGDSIEDIRKKLPAFMKTQNRAVSDSDYKYLAENFATPYNGTIGKAIISLANHGCSGNIVNVHVLAREGKSDLVKASDSLKKDLENELKRKGMLTDWVVVRDGEPLLVDIHIEILTSVRNENSIRERVNRKLADFFIVANWEFGQVLRMGDIIKTLADIKEAEGFEITFTTESSIEAGQGAVQIVEPKYYQIVRPDNIHVEFVYK